MAITPLEVAVLVGGWSAEREVSLVGGKAVAAALHGLGHKVRVVDVQRDLPALVQALTDGSRPDVVFNALHGRGGEDGCVQGVLEFLALPYTHSGVLASAMAMDKPITKKIVEAAGIRCPEGRSMTRQALQDNGFPFAPPFVIKPSDEGSSVGVRIVREGENGDILAEPWHYGEVALIERFIPGQELTVGLLGGKAMLVTEIIFGAGFYDYTVKYTAGHATHQCPATLPPAITEACKDIAERSYAALGCSGIARIDLRYDASQPGLDGLYFLELNSQPGFTPLSLLPEQAACMGMDFAALCQWVVTHPRIPQHSSP